MYFLFTSSEMVCKILYLAWSETNLNKYNYDSPSFSGQYAAYHIYI